MIPYFQKLNRCFWKYRRKTCFYFLVFSLYFRSYHANHLKMMYFLLWRVTFIYTIHHTSTLTYLTDVHSNIITAQWNLETHYVKLCCSHWTMMCCHCKEKDQWYCEEMLHVVYLSGSFFKQVIMGITSLILKQLFMSMFNWLQFCNCLWTSFWDASMMYSYSSK